MVIEGLATNNPTDRELVKSVYDGSLRGNKFDKAAKMASKLANNFKDASFTLPQIQLLYMDNVHQGNAMSLQFAIVFAEKYLASLKEAPQMYFNNLYLKCLLKKGELDKAEAYIEKYQDTFTNWTEKGTWLIRIQHARKDQVALMAQLESMIVFNYEMKNDEFQSIYNLHEYLITLAVNNT